MKLTVAHRRPQLNGRQIDCENLQANATDPLGTGIGLK